MWLQQIQSKKGNEKHVMCLDVFFEAIKGNL